MIFPALMAALHHRRRRPARRRGRQARLQGRPRRSAALHDGLHPATADPLARRHHGARPADRPVLQDGAERPGCGSRRAQLPLPGVPRQARPDRPAVPRPGGLRADRHQPVARPAGAVRHPDHRTGGTSLPPNKFPNIPPDADYDPGPPAVQLPPGVAPGPGPAPNAPFPLPVPPNDNGPPPPLAVLRPARPDRAAVRADASRRRPLRHHRPPLPGELRPAARGGCTTAGQRSRHDDVRSRNGVFVDPAGGTGVLAAASDKFVPAETWVDLMMDPRQA